MEVFIKNGYKINRQGAAGFKISLPRSLAVMGVYKLREHFDLYVDDESGNLIFKPMGGKKRDFNLTFKNEKE